ncbi:hypothetical protein [Methylobacter luteus]|uniref:hypothetical protein n=1 Tax=Methylobacter luteus TaxID=415 RepID=UPI0012DCAE7B|nr:hypothetical protein [Methylobacter luteus]
MNAMNMPGFTAEASLHKTNDHYRSIAGTFDTLAVAALAPALLFRRNTNPAPDIDVDCNTFPDNITCNECNSYGPGTLDCCNLRRPGDICIIKDLRIKW